MNEDKNTFKPADFSDAGNAAVFVREHCDDIIFTDSMGWLCWDGKRWERNEHKALELAEDFSEHMLRDAMANTGCAAQRSGSEGCRSRRQRGGQGSQRGGQAEQSLLSPCQYDSPSFPVKGYLRSCQTVYGPPRQFHGCGSAGAEHTGWDYQPGNGRLSA